MQSIKGAQHLVLGGRLASVKPLHNATRGVKLVGNKSKVLTQAMPGAGRLDGWRAEARFCQWL